MSNRIDANQIKAELDRAILTQSKKVARALKMLKANRRHQEERLHQFQNYGMILRLKVTTQAGESETEDDQKKVT
jgi:hypothetical protein